MNYFADEQSKTERRVALMELNATQEIIVKLKTVRDQQHLSIPQIKSLVDATGAYISMTTLRRVFAEHSEIDDSFSYENTLRPIAQALLINNELETDDASIRARIESFEAIMRHKNELIESLHKQIEALKEEHEKRCKEYEQRMDFLRDQIELKDQRMDRKDGMIEKLLDQVLVCGKCVMKDKE